MLELLSISLEFVVPCLAERRSRILLNPGQTCEIICIIEKIMSIIVLGRLSTLTYDLDKARRPELAPSLVSRDLGGSADSHA